MKRICLVQGLVALALIVLTSCGFSPQTPTLDRDDGTTDDQLVQAITAEDPAEEQGNANAAGGDVDR